MNSIDPFSFLTIYTLILLAVLLVMIWRFKRLRRSNWWRRSQAAFASWITRRTPWRTLIELGLIAVWAIIVGREYLDFSPQVQPVGGEYGLSIQSYFAWPPLRQCGACFLWNGAVNGGAPAFAELQGAVAHPLVAISTLLFGVINGSKLVLIGSLAMAGLAQWWLARVLGLGRTARLWSAALAVVGGHLAGRMENGVINIVLSTAACSLVLAPLLKLSLTGERRAALQLAVVGALAILSGQGYMQIGVGVAFLPAALMLVITHPRRPPHIWKEFALAGVLAVLLASIFLVPLLHFWPNFVKDIDPVLGSSQPLEYIPLNFVIRDMAFFQNESLGKLAIPYMYINYIGWVPVLLAVSALRLWSTAARRALLFFAAAIGLVLFVSSAVPLRWLLDIAPAVVSAIRYPVFIAGLAVPALLALAAMGLDRLVKQTWPNIVLALSTQHNPNRVTQIKIKWLVLGVPLLWSINSAQLFGGPWLKSVPESQDVARALSLIKPPASEWVSFPFGEGFWTAGALEAGLKVSPTFSPWHWKDREPPPSHYEGQRDKALSAAPDFVSALDDVYWQKHAANEYAAIELGEQRSPCRATAVGGNIDVDCEAGGGGTLVVHENSWTGWFVSRDGQPAELGDGPWLTTPAPAGAHHYEFRYRPWDVILGLLLSLIGVGLVIGLWIQSSRANRALPQDS